MSSKSGSSSVDEAGNTRNGPFVSGFIQYVCSYLRRISLVHMCVYDSDENRWM